MFDILDSFCDLVEDVATIVVAPVEVALSTTAAVVHPVAELVEDAVSGIKEALK